MSTGIDDPTTQAKLKKQWEEYEYCRGYGWGCYKLNCHHCQNCLQETGSS